jgi:hypothetical protein
MRPLRVQGLDRVRPDLKRFDNFHDVRAGVEAANASAGECLGRDVPEIAVATSWSRALSFRAVAGESEPSCF